MRAARWTSLLLLSLPGGLILLSACSDVSVNVVDVAAVEVTPEEVTIFEAEEETISAVVRSAGGEVLTGRTIRWSTEDPSVARVSASGVLRGYGAGNTIVQAESEGVVGTASVTVLEPPTIAFSRTDLAFHAISGQEDPEAEQVEVENGGDGELAPLTVSVQVDGPDAGWLSASLETFMAPTVLTVTVTADGLEPGLYHGTVSVSSQGASNSPHELPVTLEVEDAPPEIGLDPTEIAWSIAENAPSPSAEVSVENVGGGSLGGLSATVDYESGEATGWLDVELNSTQTPAVLTAEVSNTNLLPGVYEATIFVSSPQAGNSPRSVSVRLQVGARASPATSSIEAAPGSIVANGSSTATITVRLMDPRGDPIPAGGEAVTLATSSGSLSSVTDNGDGRYTAVLTSSTTAGTAVITGTLNGEAIEDDEEVEFVPGPAAGITIQGGNNQTGTVGQALSTPLQVQVVDAHGNRVSGATVQWTAGHGSANPSSSQTASNGRATTAWTLGTSPGSQSLQASVSGAGSVTFTATAMVGPPAAIAITGGNNQSGTVATSLSTPLEVKVTDAHGNGVSGVAVTWSPAGGTANPSPSNTDATGHATTTWTLGTAAGQQSLNASAAGVVEPVAFTATADPGPVSSTRSSVTADPDKGIIAGGMGESTSTVTVILRDTHGNLLAGMVGDISPAVSGQGEASDVTATGSPGTYQFTVTNLVAQTVTVTVTVAGVVLEDKPTIEFVACCE